MPTIKPPRISLANRLGRAITFSGLSLSELSRRCDLLSSAPIKNTGYLVSSRLRAVLEQFALPLHRFYLVPAIYRRKPLGGCFWLQLPQPRLALSEGMSPAQAEEFIASIPALGSLDLLLWYRPERFAYCFLSDPLRSALESAKITGVGFGTAKLFRSPGRRGNAEHNRCR
jgi:hypothetical protein